MLLIIAHHGDAVARTLVDRWGADEVGLVTPGDLSIAGWSYCVGAIQTAQAIVDRRPLATAAIDMVLTRLPGVTEYDLAHIVPADRAYVAAEMTAFLLAWLTALPCPVLNRPTPTCLAGPSWRPEKWVHVAAQLGIPVRSVHRNIATLGSDSAMYRLPESITMTVLGKECWGLGAPVLAQHAQALAAAAGVDLLDVYFSGPEADACCVGASLWPDVAASHMADALLSYSRRSRS